MDKQEWENLEDDFKAKLQFSDKRIEFNLNKNVDKFEVLQVHMDIFNSSFRQKNFEF